MKSFGVLKAALERSARRDGPLSGAPRHASVCVLVAETLPTPHSCFICRAELVPLPRLRIRLAGREWLLLLLPPR
jgi:hypothetical protein